MEKMADALLFGNFGMQNVTAAIQLYELLAKEGSYKAQNVSFGKNKSQITTSWNNYNMKEELSNSIPTLLRESRPREVTATHKIV